jgi:hypothetical protein
MRKIVVSKADDFYYLIKCINPVRFEENKRSIKEETQII